MARYCGSVCRICRRENVKLFLKGDRCYSDKCAFDRRSYAPGIHGQRRRGKFSDYGIQLREKQKVKRTYGLSEKQFRLIFTKADREKGITGINMLMLLERRMDNVVYRFGFSSSRTQGRHFIRHRHFLVNGKKVDIPSYLVNPGDILEITEKGKKIQAINDSLNAVARRGLPQWLEIDKDIFRGKVNGLPMREDLTMPIQEQLIVEFYSKL